MISAGFIPLDICSGVLYAIVMLATAGDSAKQKRSAQGFSDFWSVPATALHWPVVTYMDHHGN